VVVSQGNGVINVNHLFEHADGRVNILFFIIKDTQEIIGFKEQVVKHGDPVELVDGFVVLSLVGVNGRAAEVSENVRLVLLDDLGKDVQGFVVVLFLELDRGFVVLFVYDLDIVELVAETFGSSAGMVSANSLADFSGGASGAVPAISSAFMSSASVERLIFFDMEMLSRFSSGMVM